MMIFIILCINSVNFLMDKIKIKKTDLDREEEKRFGNICYHPNRVITISQSSIVF